MIYTFIEYMYLIKRQYVVSVYVYGLYSVYSIYNQVRKECSMYGGQIHVLYMYTHRQSIGHN